MNNELKSFLKSNSELIDQEKWEELYELAYEYISGDACSDMTKMLTTVFTDVNFKDIALYVFRKHVKMELNNFLVNRNHDVLDLSSFIRLYMNHSCGLTDYEAKEDLITNPLII